MIYSKGSFYLQNNTKRSTPFGLLHRMIIKYMNDVKKLCKEIIRIIYEITGGTTHDI